MSDTQLQVGVKVLLKNPDGKYLVVHRSAAKYPEVPNPWDSVGGRIHPGTSLLDNLKREVAEETKLEVISEPRLLKAQDILRITGKHIVRLTHLAETSGEPVLDEEHDDYQWLSIEQIKQLDGLDIYLKEVLETVPIE